MFYFFTIIIYYSIIIIHREMNNCVYIQRHIKTTFTSILQPCVARYMLKKKNHPIFLIIRAFHITSYHDCIYSLLLLVIFLRCVYRICACRLHRKRFFSSCAYRGILVLFFFDGEKKALLLTICFAVTAEWKANRATTEGRKRGAVKCIFMRSLTEGCKDKRSGVINCVLSSNEGNGLWRSVPLWWRGAMGRSDEDYIWVYHCKCREKTAIQCICLL